MDANSNATTRGVSDCALGVARAAEVWAIGGAVLFLPCAALMGFLGLVFMGPLGFLLLIPIGFTFWGAVLFCAGAAALRRGEPQARRTLVWAALATWNILVLNSVSMLWPAVVKAVSEWDVFLAELHHASLRDNYFLLCAFLLVVVTGAILAAAIVLPGRGPGALEPAFQSESEPSTPSPRR